ncbi:hypothetical protein HPP92_025628 [Vanilla planifolia]|uniref:DUF177 domain-containing protein n=1 Tax=Vanilla planifolia TaxID=51239 RepID=A0A835U7X8_VANPL|nr:hypothetical protein HPP92_025628 [Vanilla planifolia]
MARLHSFVTKHINLLLFNKMEEENKAHRNRQLKLSVSRSNFRTQPSTSNKQEKSALLHHKRSSKKSPRTYRRLITIPTSDGRWESQWNCDYVLSLQELQLADLAEEKEKNAEVLVSLSIQKHTGFGYSVNGRILTSFKRNCSCCCISFSKEIDTTFDVWILPSRKEDEVQEHEIGGSDQVIYVKRGSNVVLDSVVQDTIRLIASIKETCSEACEDAAITWQGSEQQRSFDQRWSQLLELKNAMK